MTFWACRQTAKEVPRMKTEKVKSEGDKIKEEDSVSGIEKNMREQVGEDSK